MENDVLIDSNVYIDLIRRGKDVLGTLYHWAQVTDWNLAICGIVRLEVLRGVISPKAYRELNDFMNVMVDVPSSNRLWDEAATLAWELDRRGAVIPGTDALIAASALRANAAVMTSDAHFSKIDGLRVLTPPKDWFA